MNFLNPNDFIIFNASRCIENNKKYDPREFDFLGDYINKENWSSEDIRPISRKGFNVKIITLNSNIKKIYPLKAGYMGYNPGKKSWSFITEGERRRFFHIKRTSTIVLLNLPEREDLHGEIFIAPFKWSDKNIIPLVSRIQGKDKNNFNKIKIILYKIGKTEIFPEKVFSLEYDRSEKFNGEYAELSETEMRLIETFGLK